MAPLLIALLTLAVLVYLYLTRKAAQPPAFSGASRWLFWAGLLVLVLYGALWLALSAAESGQASLTASLFHIVPGLAALAMAWLARKLPLETGLALGAQGMALAIYTLTLVSQPLVIRLSSTLFNAAPPILAGLLILWACAFAQSRKAQ